MQTSLQGSTFYFVFTAESIINLWSPAINTYNGLSRLQRALSPKVVPFLGQLVQVMGRGVNVKIWPFGPAQDTTKSDLGFISPCQCRSWLCQTYITATFSSAQFQFILPFLTHVDPQQTFCILVFPWLLENLSSDSAYQEHSETSCNQVGFGNLISPYPAGREDPSLVVDGT